MNSDKQQFYRDLDKERLDKVNKRNRRISLALFALIVFLFLFFYPYTHKVNKTVPAMYRNENGVYEKSYIYIDAKVKSTLFRDTYKYFTGENLNEDSYWHYQGSILQSEFIKAPSYAYHTGITLQRGDSKEQDFISTVKSIRGGGIESVFTGFIQCSRNFEDIIIYRYNIQDGQNSRELKEPIVWVGPALDEQEAETILKKYRK